MERSHNGFHFQASNSPKSSATAKPSLSGENNENDIKQDQMDSKSQNLKKPFHKHFMSPTVSATSKATIPRKKILAEKNESTSSFDVHFQKSPIHESRSSSLLYPGTPHPDRSSRTSSSAFSANNCTSQFDDDEQNTSFADSSLKPYDPLTNYLSPRPQYLRYKPYRRREIFERQESLEEKEDGSFLQRSSSFESKNVVDEIKSLECVQAFLISPSQEGTAMLQNQDILRAQDGGHDDDGDGDEEEVVEEEEEEEEEEEIEGFEEKIWSLKGVLKFLFLLIVMGLSTSYISSMNSPRPSPMQQTIWGLRDGCYGILNHSLEAIPTNLHGGNGVMRCTQTGKAQAGSSGVNQQSGYREFGKVQMVVDDEEVLVESGDDIVRMFESLIAQNLDICTIGFEKSDTILDQLLNVNTAGSEDIDSDQGEVNEVDFDWPQWGIAENNIVDGEMEMIDDCSNQIPGLVESAKTDVATEQELNMVEQSSQGLQVQETVEKLDSFEEDKPSSGSASGNDEVDQLENNLEAKTVEGIFMKKTGEELEDTGAERTIGVTGTIETHHMVEKVGETFVRKSGEKMVEATLQRPEIVNDESSESARVDYDNYEGPDGSRSGAGLKLMMARYMELGPIHKSCIGFSVFAAILLASLVYIYPVRAIQAPSKASQPVKVHPEKSNRKGKSTQVQPHVDVERLQKKVESITVKPSTMFFSMEETREELSYSRAPKVELLGELVLGEVRSSIRSCGRESKKIEAEEESIKAISHQESRAHSVPPAQPSVQDTGSTDSPSYGSFTAETKILKKQGGRDGNVKIVTTPVRRSSRLQNRSVTSP